MSDRTHRRLAAIVAADVAGFSRLVDENEEATLASLRAHRVEFIDPLVEAHGGRVANTAGDSLLLEFPSAVDALRFAIAFQEGMAKREAGVEPSRQIRFRAGVNVGDVITEGRDLLGSGVNVAARLEALAEPGGIILSRSLGPRQASPARPVEEAGRWFVNRSSGLATRCRGTCARHHYRW